MHKARAKQTEGCNRIADVCNRIGVVGDPAISGLQKSAFCLNRRVLLTGWEGRLRFNPQTAAGAKQADRCFSLSSMWQSPAAK